MNRATAALLLTFVLSACRGGGSGTPATVVPSQPTQSVPLDNWATLSHDQQRSGFEPQSIGVTKTNVGQLGLRWTFTSAAGFQAGPIVVSGIVYIVDRAGVVSALRASDGLTLWSKQLPHATDFVMTPALYDGILFVAAHNLGPSPFYALDPSTGTTLWTQTMPGGIHSAPVVMNGTVYVASATGDVPYCISGKVSGFDERSGSVSPTVWPAMNTTTSSGIWAPLSTDGANVYFGTGNVCAPGTIATDKAIVSASSDLSLRWYDQAGPGADDDIGGGITLSNGSGYVETKSGVFYSVNLATGKVNWSESLGAPDGWGGFTTPSITGDTIITSGGYARGPSSSSDATGGMLYGLSPDGSIKWVRHTQYAVLDSAASTTGVTFIGVDASMQAIDPESGSVLWSYPTSGLFKGSPAIGPSGIFAADESGILYAFGIGGKAPTSSARSAGRLTLPNECLF